MNDGDTAPKIIRLNESVCASCHRIIRLDELYGAFGLCSQCLEHEGLRDAMGGE